MTFSGVNDETPVKRNVLNQINAETFLSSSSSGQFPLNLLPHLAKQGDRCLVTEVSWNMFVSFYIKLNAILPQSKHFTRGYDDGNPKISMPLLKELSLSLLHLSPCAKTFLLLLFSCFLEQAYRQIDGE